MNSLIYDRTQADVLEKNSKGQYNASDLNRVEEWCKFLADEITAHGYPITITTKRNWTQHDMRYATDMERIRKNILKIMQGFTFITKIYVNADNFDYRKANNWEQILNELNIMRKALENYQVYSGVANSGQERFWQNRFRTIHTLLNKTWEELQYTYWNEIPNDTTWLELMIE